MFYLIEDFKGQELTAEVKPTCQVYEDPISYAIRQKWDEIICG